MAQTVIKRCGHCGNKTPFEQFGEYTQEIDDPEFRFWSTLTYKLYKCHTCSKPSLEQIVHTSEEEEYGPFIPAETLYPVESRILNEIPVEIRENYEEVL